MQHNTTIYQIDTSITNGTPKNKFQWQNLKSWKTPYVHKGA